MHDDRDDPHRQTNTLILNQVGHPPPPSVLGTVLASTAGTTPLGVAALPEWEHRKTTWRIVGCTDHALFHVHAHKGVSDWYGSGDRVMRGEPENITSHVAPFSRLLGATFEFSDMRGGGFGEDRASVTGVWRICLDGGDDITVPTHASNETTREALREVIDTVLAAFR